MDYQPIYSVYQGETVLLLFTSCGGNQDQLLLCWQNGACRLYTHGCTLHLSTDDDNNGLFYTSQDLEYVYFVHSLCLLGRVLLYSGGRALFPVILPDTEGRQE